MGLRLRPPGTWSSHKERLRKSKWMSGREGQRGAAGIGWLYDSPSDSLFGSGFYRRVCGPGAR